MADENLPTPDQQNAAPAPVDDEKSRIEKLEAKKAELIEQIKKAYRRIRYKKYEQKALEPFLEKTKDVQIAPLRKFKRSLDFKISTAAYTPKMEREILKKMREVDQELESVKEVEKARRKARYVVQDILDSENEIKKIEEELKVIREELRKYYESNKSARIAAKRVADERAKEEEDMVSLGDIALIEKNDD
ncbi:hypothetical protein HY990_07040 [Candidatus Micrarchaeota archaeon]|nr:hypothetical protein [Candidatus Micrarchaeota archaeon]